MIFRMNRILIFLFVVLLFPLMGTGQTRKYSNEFLAIGVGARALGMSNAQVASVNDITAGYWNPAGLTRVEADFQLSAMHSEYFAGIAKYDYGAIARRIDSNSTVGITFIRFGVDDIPNTTELIDADGNWNYDRIYSFTAADYAVMLSYARKLPVPGLSVGGNAKIVHRLIGDMGKAWGFGLDLGAQYNRNGWMLGLMARDITTTVNSWSYDLNDRTIEVFQATGNEIPENSMEITLPKVILGAARQFNFTKDLSVTPEVGFDFTFDGNRNVAISGDPVSIDPNLGLEIGYLSFIYLRAGVGNYQRVKAEVGNFNETSFQPNMGVGVRIRNFYIDYALTDIGNQSEALYSNVFSLKLDINKK